MATYHLKTCFLLLFVITVFKVKTGTGTTPINLLEMAQTAVAGCFEDSAETTKIEITDEGLLALLEGSRNAPRNTKCIRYCIMRQNKLFTDESLLDPTEMLNFFQNLSNNTMDAGTLKAAIERCNAVASQELDRCERAHLSTMCIISELNE